MKKNPLIVIAASMVVYLTTQYTMAQNTQRGSPTTLQLKNVEMTVRLMSPISTKTSQRGDRFPVQVITPELYKNAVIEGHINTIKKPKKRDKAEVSFAFETMTLGGATFNVQADLKEVANSQGVKDVDEEGRAIGKTSKKKAVESALIGSALGALVGGAVGGGKGAATGAGAGAAAGLLIGITFTTSGSDMEFAPGSRFTLLVSDRSQH
jgi:hypothetical protein